MAYATPLDLADRFNLSDLKDLGGENGEEVADITTNSIILAALESASGRVNAAVLVGELYTVEDLTGLEGDSLAYLKQIVCELAIVYLITRQPGKYSAEYLKELRENAENILELLRTGKNVFNIDTNSDAQTIDVDGPSIVDYENLNLVTDRTKHYYPRRGLPRGRGGW